MDDEYINHLKSIKQTFHNKLFTFIFVLTDVLKCVYPFITRTTRAPSDNLYGSCDDRSNRSDDRSSLWLGQVNCVSAPDSSLFVAALQTGVSVRRVGR